MATNNPITFNIGLGVQPDQLKDSDVFREILKLYSACNIIARTLDSYTGAMPPDSEIWPQLTPSATLTEGRQNTFYPLFGEAVSTGMMVALYNDAGVLKARKAGGPAMAGGVTRGFVTGNHAIGDYGPVTLSGLHTLVSGLTPGALYYTSTAVAGNITSIKPASPDSQAIGYALSPTTIYFKPDLEAV
jgi:hypothetical protein